MIKLIVAAVIAIFLWIANSDERKENNRKMAEFQKKFDEWNK